MNLKALTTALPTLIFATIAFTSTAHADSLKANTFVKLSGVGNGYGVVSRGNTNDRSFALFATFTGDQARGSCGRSKPAAEKIQWVMPTNTVVVVAPHFEVDFWSTTQGGNNNSWCWTEIIAKPKDTRAYQTVVQDVLFGVPNKGGYVVQCRAKFCYLEKWDRNSLTTETRGRVRAR